MKKQMERGSHEMTQILTQMICTINLHNLLHLSLTDFYNKELTDSELTDSSSISSLFAGVF